MEFRWNNVLAVGAHPDDIEYGCLGFLLKRLGKSRMRLYVASHGSLGDPSSGPVREAETRRALEVLQPETLRVRSQAGIFPQDFETVSNEIYELLEDFEVDLILTHSPHDTHQEHRLLYEITLSAARRSRASILRYGILSSTLDFAPRIFVDISAHFEPKLRALRAHASQSGKSYMSDQHLEIFHRRQNTNLLGMGHCEAFEVERLLI